MSTHLHAVALLVDDYDEAIAWLSRCLGFTVSADTPEPGKRWVTMQPPGGGCSLVLAQAANTRQRIGVGNQFAGRVGFFLYTTDFEASALRLRQNEVPIVREPEQHAYGQVLVFRDKWGNLWDLIEPAK